MQRNRPHSPQTVAILFALADYPEGWRYGYDLCHELDLKAGTLYPILMRLADRGLLETKWETEAPQGRPARHLYRLTGEGREVAAELKRAAGTSRRIRFRPQPEGA